MNEREAFEKKYPMPKGCCFDPNMNLYKWDTLQAQNADGAISQNTLWGLWQSCWQAAHMAEGGAEEVRRDVHLIEAVVSIEPLLEIEMAAYPKPRDASTWADGVPMDTPLWVVCGYESFPQVFPCIIRSNKDGPVIWGYSIWKRNGGYRTLGIHAAEFVVRHDICFFFRSQELALEYVGQLITPVKNKP